MNAKKHLTNYVKDQEAWIKSQIGSLPRVTGDTEAAEDMLMEVLADAGYDTWAIDYSTEEWFNKLAIRKARIDRLES